MEKKSSSGVLLLISAFKSGLGIGMVGTALGESCTLTEESGISSIVSAGLGLGGTEELELVSGFRIALSVGFGEGGVEELGSFLGL